MVFRVFVYFQDLVTDAMLAAHSVQGIQASLCECVFNRIPIFQRGLVRETFINEVPEPAWQRRLIRGVDVKTGVFVPIILIHDQIQIYLVQDDLNVVTLDDPAVVRDGLSALRAFGQLQDRHRLFVTDQVNVARGECKQIRARIHAVDDFLPTNLWIRKAREPLGRVSVHEHPKG